MSTCARAVFTPPVFEAPRAPGELDLIELVREMLVSAGRLDNVIAHYDTDRRIRDAKDRPAEYQRRALNQFWTLQLMSAGTNTTQQRFCLVQDGAVVNWLALFEKQILPFALAHALPKEVGLHG